MILPSPSAYQLVYSLVLLDSDHGWRRGVGLHELGLYCEGGQDHRVHLSREHEEREQQAHHPVHEHGSGERCYCYTLRQRSNGSTVKLALEYMPQLTHVHNLNNSSDVQRHSV